MAYGYIGQIIIMIISFVSRSIFIRYLGIEYLGVSGLFANVLGVLSLAELGIGSAMTFTLYKPVALDEKEQIKSLMFLYKRIYRFIALFISIIGLALVPFIDRIVTSDSHIELLKVYFVLFLAGTVASYFSAYKRSLLIAYQKQYLSTRFDTIFTVVIHVLNIIVLILFKNYLVYLAVTTSFTIIRNIALNVYINKLYPYLKEKNVQPLEQSLMKSIKEKIRALFLHKFSKAVIEQTDYIVISAFVSITAVGLMTNYNMLLLNVKKIFSITISSILGSLGNLVATESDDNKYRAYKIYSLLMFWLYGIVAIGFFTLADSFISLWIGERYIIDNFTWLIVILNFFLYGNLAALWEIKLVSGIFVKDKWVDAIAAAVNITVSLILVQTLGMLGVFLGTLANTAVVYMLRPRIIYRQAFDRNVAPFFLETLGRLLLVAVGCAISVLIRNLTMPNISWGMFIVNVIITFAVTNVLFYVVYRKTEAFNYLKDKVIGIISSVKNRANGS